jgi:hypothetical protein
MAQVEADEGARLERGEQLVVHRQGGVQRLIIRDDAEGRTADRRSSSW